MARPSIVSVPCSITCRPTPRSRSSASGGPALFLLQAGKPREMVNRAALAGTVAVAALICLDIADHAVLVWPESTAHHTTNPSPPLFGILSIVLCLIGIAVLGTAVLRRRAVARLGDQGTRTAG